MNHSRWFFKGWSKSQGRFLTPEELSLAGVWMGMKGHLECHPDVLLLHYTGRIDNYRTPLFEGDVVEFDQVTEFGVVRRRGFMKFVDPPGHYSIAMDGEEDMKGMQYETQNVRKVGTMLEHPEMVKSDPSYA